MYKFQTFFYIFGILSFGTSGAFLYFAIVKYAISIWVKRVVRKRKIEDCESRIAEVERMLKQMGL